MPSMHARMHACIAWEEGGDRCERMHAPLVRADQTRTQSTAPLSVPAVRNTPARHIRKNLASCSPGIGMAVMVCDCLRGLAPRAANPLTYGNRYLVLAAACAARGAAVRVAASETRRGCIPVSARSSALVPLEGAASATSNARARPRVSSLISFCSLASV